MNFNRLYNSLGRGSIPRLQTLFSFCNFLISFIKGVEIGNPYGMSNIALTNFGVKTFQPLKMCLPLTFTPHTPSSVYYGRLV